MLFFEKILEAFYIMWQDSAWSYLHYEFYELIEWAKCGEGILSTVPTVLWAMGAAAIAHRLLTALFRRFMFRQIPLWEIMLQEHQVQSEEHLEGRKIMQQWLIWMCGVTPLAVYIQTRPRPEPPPLMIWITTSPWQRREMGPHGYYLNRPLSSLQSTTVTGDRQQTTTLRRAFSDSKIMIKETPKKRRYSKSV
ncbi:uncharacterized protein LOC113519920 isoform X2 [Galleria mellonella]|uniref:Uncharacterized protein LOC113519920 isoform X2 n=1 Tax=Galleria mellonella TaxID=7137 RepID=A0ABM3N3Q4_GALME|nr:uncharacterized protein LOC113519920 isoform X2 [Galleria mellonella]